MHKRISHQLRKKIVINSISAVAIATHKMLMERKSFNCYNNNNKNNDNNNKFATRNSSSRTNESLK